MERAKRLERDESNSQPPTAPITSEFSACPGTPGGAPDGELPKESVPEDASLSRIETNDDPDLSDVIAAWPELNTKFKAAILAIVRIS